MEYATMFAVMGTAIVWLIYKNFTLSKKLYMVLNFMDRMVDGDVKVVRKGDGFDIIIKGE